MSEPAFKADDGWLEFHQNPSVPEFKLPDGSVDAHCHVFGPGSEFPYASERKYTPCDAPWHKLRALHEHLGLDRCVIVQATCHGFDNGALVDALMRFDGKARGVASVRQEVTDETLDRLHAAGVRGVRFNFVKRLVDTLPHDTLRVVAKRIQRLGWHLVIYFEAHDLPELADFLGDLPGTIVLDHMGRPDVTRDPHGEEFDRFISLLADNENMWAKVSCPDRLSVTGPPGYEDVVPFARRVIESFPNRVLWGTDWPHPNLKSHMPDDGKLVDYVSTIVVTAEQQRQLLVDNPLRLYWPEECG